MGEAWSVMREKCNKIDMVPLNRVHGVSQRRAGQCCLTAAPAPDGSAEASVMVADHVLSHSHAMPCNAVRKPKQSPVMFLLAPPPASRNTFACSIPGRLSFKMR
jgi:hypothetical protein